MNRKKRWIDSILVLVLLLGLFYSSSQPYENQDIRGNISQLIPDAESVGERLDGFSFTYGHSEVSVEEDGVAGYIEFFVRKGTHFCTFALLTLLFYRLLRNWYHPPVALPWSGLLAVLAAVLDEWHQTFTPHRTGIITDILLDSTGMFTMLLLILGWRTYRKNRTRTRFGRKQLRP
ncbi:VanZ family protein [Brevibacillus fulvus]|uniref:VanZ family protein n=1 Tax=Brevibacillus fulvus TaxID=1125967 RepID=A0A939BV41_9BACL|nr:VanZ family protein [Brevibacillus fulvus]MBM7591079.1 VanZ family protein [Brevibacillus fulvus]